jgi:hypothetical protein
MGELQLNSPAAAPVCVPMNWLHRIFVPLAFGIFCATSFADNAIRPGELWRDTDGKPIQAHGGGVLQRSNVFYWYGEDRTPGGRGVVSCYSSTNLCDWKREGVALSRDALPRMSATGFNARRGGYFVERPKVIFNPATKKFVMWMHLEAGRYTYSRAGIATSDSPVGPFTFLHAIRPITNNFNFDTNGPTRQHEFGGTFRDMNLFVDDDGRAYTFYASEDNWTMYVVRLNADFTGPEEPAVEGKTWARILVRQMREAPAPFKHEGRYYLVTSACNGWKPNEADCATATNILGAWKMLGNPCRGAEAKTTFGAQSTFVLPRPGKPGEFIFMADRWNPDQLSDSRYVWLPFKVAGPDEVEIPWRERWELK